MRVASFNPTEALKSLAANVNPENVAGPTREDGMWTIRADQLTAMNRLRDQEYARALARFFRTDNPDLVSGLTEADLDARTTAAVLRARGYRIRTGRGMFQFVGLDLAMGPGFDRIPAIHELLTLPGHCPDRQLRLLLQTARYRHEVVPRQSGVATPS
jgi:hypothetical protein